MAPLPDYVAGTITLTNGDTAFTGTGTGWLAAGFREGDTILGIEDNPGVTYVIESITDNDAGTLTQEWQGATGTYTYRMRYLSDGQRVTAQARQLIELLGNGNLEGLAGVASANNTMPYFTGVGTMGSTPLTAFARTLLDDANVGEFWSTIGATAPPQAAFRRGNILGTVSQSGGVPTGAVIERGSNANGEYVRFADGTQMCWAELTLSYTSTSFCSEIWTYPAAFSMVPKPNGAVTSMSNATPNYASITAVAETPGTGTVTSTELRVNRIQGLTNFVSGDTVGISAFVIGRWF